MSTVKQLIEFLSAMPQDATVQVMVDYTRGFETYTKFVPVDLDECSPAGYSKLAEHEEGASYDEVIVTIRG